MISTGSDRAPPVAIHPDSGKDDRMFRLDALYDGLVSGRLCGQAFKPEIAQLLLVLLERLEWVPDTRRLAGALPHFAEQFGANEIRSTLVTLGFDSSVAFLAGNRLASCPPETLVADKCGDLWLLHQENRGVQLIQPGEYSEDVRPVRRNKLYRTIQFEKRIGITDEGVPQNSGQQSWVGETISRFSPEMRLMLLLTVLSGISAILIAFGITTIFDTVIPTRNYSTLAGILVGLGLVFVFDTVLRHIRAKIVGRVSGRLEYILGSALLGKLLRLPTAMLTGVSLSDQLARLRQFESIRDLFSGPFVLLILELPLALLFLGTLTIIAWPLALLLAIYAAVFVACAFFLSPAIRRESRNQGAAQSALNRVTLEVLEQRRQIGREGLAPIWVAKVDAKVRALARARRRLNALTRWLAGLSQASLPIAAASVIGYGAILVMQGAITGGTLVAATILTWRLFAPVKQGLQLLPKLQDVLRLFQQIDALMRLPEEENGRESGLHVQPHGHLMAKGVVMRHPKSNVPILMGVNLEIPHGKFIAVAGNSGAGKTTLLRVLAGQIAPQAGVVLFNDLNLTQLSRSFRARNIAYVSQEPLFFYGSIAQNLRLADPGADDARLIDALVELGLGQWINSLPNGIDTRLDPTVDGDLLSPSMLTGIAVAQALLGNPVVLLLDEPAGHLDSALEAQLIEALEKRRGRMTSLIVTHRPSLIRRADHVISMNSGAATMRTITDIESAAS